MTSAAHVLLKASVTGTQLLNIPGYIPFLSTISGGARRFLAKIQLITGIALVVIAAVQLAPPVSAVIGLKFVGHCVYNYCRGSSEASMILIPLNIVLDLLAFPITGTPSALNFFASLL